MKTLHAILSILAVVIAGVIIALGCGGSSGGGSTTNTSATGTSATGTNGGGPTMVNMTGSHTFNPTNVTVAAGSTVQWNNPDTINHTVTSDVSGSGPLSDNEFPTGVPSGSTFSFTVPAGTASGTVFFYHCRFHGSPGNGTSLGTGMVGSITVH